MCWTEGIVGEVEEGEEAEDTTQELATETVMVLVMAMAMAIVTGTSVVQAQEEIMAQHSRNPTSMLSSNFLHYQEQMAPAYPSQKSPRPGLESREAGPIRSMMCKMSEGETDLQIPDFAFLDSDFDFEF